VTFYSAHAPIAITDLACSTGTITVSGLGSVIADVEVQTDTLSHTFDSDLDIYLISPASDTCDLSTHNGGSGDNYINTRFDDDAATGIVSGTAPFTGNFRPEEALSTFDGENPNGVWKLRVCDRAGGDIGSLRRWRLQIRAPLPGDTC
jgi:subtilisin-like proprotein convertase family protein